MSLLGAFTVDIAPLVWHGLVKGYFAISWIEMVVYYRQPYSLLHVGWCSDFDGECNLL